MGFLTLRLQQWLLTVVAAGAFVLAPSAIVSVAQDIQSAVDGGVTI